VTVRGTQNADRAKGFSTVGKLVLLTVGMFGFAFALVPLYNLLCDITGLGGRTGGQYEYVAADMAVDKDRLVKVNFITNTNGGMPWSFGSEKGGMRVHPGEPHTVNFYVKNPTNRIMVGQAVPSVVPVRAADMFHKTECFCFEQQVLMPGEEMEMPMRFIVGPELAPNVASISLSYTLFDVTDMASADVIDAAVRAKGQAQAGPIETSEG
jgi:cytochrome c oxidase assembly protein subunit 11